MAQTFTLTFGDQAENHVGMEKLGQLASHGFSFDDLVNYRSFFQSKGCVTELHHLNELIADESKRSESEDAYVLVARRGLAAFLSDEKQLDNFFEEQAQLEKDTKALMYGRVVNKHARHNLCFADVGHAPNYAEGQGTVVPFASVPLLTVVRHAILELTGHLLVAEGNYYFDLNKCGIGYHGDAERRIVIGIRVGETMPLHYRWYKNNEIVSPTLKLSLHHGDIYFMSEKATGYDWKSRSRFTLRHAAGCSKFLDEQHDLN